MLHNKRIQGVLYGKIVEKSKINENDLYNTSFYPIKTSDEEKDSIYLIYNHHSLMMNFENEKTEKCTNGCYLLITYEQQFSEGDFSLIGYEFTILSRFWNFTDYISPIVDIPFNEYLVGAFEKGSISHHYYSINVPDDADKFIIQIEGNYLDGFYGEGRKKISTTKLIENNAQLEIYNTQNMLTLDIDSLHYKEKTMSFAFRPKDYYANVFSFYYFRILYFKKNETIFFPIDSNLGNLCIPEKDNITEMYYCNLIFKNNYNELSTKFVLALATQNEYFTINISKIKTNDVIYQETDEFMYIYSYIEEDIDSFIFKFIFQNNEIKNIISCFSDKIINVYPQIYSSQMFYIQYLTKINNFRLKNNYTFNFQHINGYAGYLSFSFLENQVFEGSRNFKGKPMAISINSDTDHIDVSTGVYEYIYYIKLVYDMRNKGIEEIKSGEVRSYLIKGDRFPLYYYFKIKNENYINVDINLRLNSYNESLLQNEFDISGYILDEDTIKRQINGEYIVLTDPYEGYYSNSFKVGLLQINKISESNDTYIMVEIKNREQVEINSYLLIELVTKEYNNDIYFLPINQYTIQTFDGENNTVRRENKYYLSCKDKSWDQSLIELSSAYDDVVLEFDNSSEVDSTYDYSKGFKKYRVFEAKDCNVYFSVINPNNRSKANYMIRYYYTGLGGEYDYYFNVNPERKIIKLSNDNATISLTFEPIKILFVDVVDRDDIYFDIYGFLYKMNETSDEHINTTSILYDQIPLYENKTRFIYSLNNSKNWTLIYENIPRKNNYIYDLQLKINVILEDRIYNEEFLIFTTKIDLTDIKLEKAEEDDASNTWVVLVSVFGSIFVLLIIFFIIKYIRLRKSTLNLKNEVKHISYSRDVKKKVSMEQQDNTRKDSQYEETFI